MWATSCEILVASAKFLVTLATRKAQFPTLQEVSLWRVKSSGVRQSKIYKSLLGIKGLTVIFSFFTAVSLMWYPSSLEILKTRNFHVRFTFQVVSNEDQNLTVTSEKNISVDGHEGLHFDGKMFHFDADEDVVISSILVSKWCYKLVLIFSSNLVTIPRTMHIKIVKESPGLIFVHSQNSSFGFFIFR